MGPDYPAGTFGDDLPETELPTAAPADLPIRRVAFPRPFIATAV